MAKWRDQFRPRKHLKSLVVVNYMIILLILSSNITLVLILCYEIKKMNEMLLLQLTLKVLCNFKNECVNAIKIILKLE